MNSSKELDRILSILPQEQKIEKDDIICYISERQGDIIRYHFTLFTGSNKYITENINTGKIEIIK
jgi:hypothetical protein